jgi:DNA polymerase-1
MPLLRVLLEMETLGILLDRQVIDQINIRVSQELGQLRVQIIDLIGHEHADINLNSPKQLEELLFVNLKLPAVKKTTQKTGYSTDQEVLRDLSKIHPVPALIARYRELLKLKSTYLDALGEYVNLHTKRIHTTYSQTGVATGRLSSSEPNLQNIPVDRFHIRSAFKAPVGNIFLSADYSQIELRVLAYLSQDERLMKAFQEKQDIHALTAAGLFNCALTDVTHEQRQLGKRINFSILYGLTAHGLSKDLDISYAMAKSYIEKFMNQYPGVSRWMEQVIEEVTKSGYVATAWGRRRYLPGIYERNKTLHDLAKRVAINTKAQGTAADIMKIGMINLERTLRHHNLTSKIVLQIHDELLLQVPEAEIERVTNLTKDILQSVALNWNVPLEVTTRTGANWQEVTK